MNDFQLILYLIAALVPTGAFFYGRYALRNMHALYLKMIIDGVGCIGLSQWFNFVYGLTVGAHPAGFNVGILGVIGSIAFFLLANYGQIDSLADDGSAAFRKYRYIAGIAPALILIVYAVLFFRVSSLEMRIVLAVVCLVLAFADYFHLKHLLLPDVDFGVVKCLRPFNLLALIYSALYIAKVSFTFMENEIAYSIILGASIIVSGLLVPLTVVGVKKWTV